jgi:hypothetical protein
MNLTLVAFLAIIHKDLVRIKRASTFALGEFTGFCCSVQHVLETRDIVNFGHIVSRLHSALPVENSGLNPEMFSNQLCAQSSQLIHFLYWQVAVSQEFSQDKTQLRNQYHFGA